MDARSTTRVGGGDAVTAHAVLGVTESAGTRELTHAYWQQARHVHPDVNAAPDAAEQFVALSRAYRSALQAMSRRGEPSGLDHGERVPGAPRLRRRSNADGWLVAGPVRVTPLHGRAVAHQREARP